MTIVGLIVVFIMLWWLVLFMTLPFGAHKSNKLVKGQEAGAPEKTHLKTKLMVTTLISLLLTALYFYLISHGYLAFLHIRDGMQ